MFDKLLPPTDNLYKFVAVGGLVLIGYAIFGWNSSSNRFYDKANAYQQARVDAQVYELESLQAQKLESNLRRHENSIVRRVLIENLEKASAAARSGQEPAGLLDVEGDVKVLAKPSELADIESFEEEISRYNVRLRSGDAATDEQLGAWQEQVKLAEARALRALVFFLFLGSVGAATSSLGFYLWWSRFQKFQDLIVENSSKI